MSNRGTIRKRRVESLLGKWASDRTVCEGPKTASELLGAFIYARRKLIGLRQEDLANRVDLARVSIVGIEAGRNHVSLPLLVRLAHALDLSPAQMLTEAGIG